MPECLDAGMPVRRRAQGGEYDRHLACHRPKCRDAEMLSGR